jgi:hypothetical protein
MRGHVRVSLPMRMYSLPMRGHPCGGMLGPVYLCEGMLGASLPMRGHVRGQSIPMRGMLGPVYPCC